MSAPSESVVAQISLGVVDVGRCELPAGYLGSVAVYECVVSDICSHGSTIRLGITQRWWRRKACFRQVGSIDKEAGWVDR